MTAEREATDRLAPETTDRRALEDQRRFLLRSLADLEEERAAGDLGEEDYLELRDHYTAKAAAVLRRLESGDIEPAGGPGDPPTSPHRGPSAERAAPGKPAGRPRRPWRAVAIVAGVLAFGALVGWGVARAAKPSLPGQTITGSQANQQADDLIQGAKLQAEGKPVAALKLYNKVLAADPTQPEALTSKGWILAQAGLTNEALSDFVQAEAADPSYSDVHVYRGIVLLDGKADPSGALKELRYYLRHHPDPQLSSLARKAMTRAEQELAKAKGE